MHSPVICPVDFRSKRIDFHRADDIKSSVLEAQRQTATARENVNGSWFFQCSEFCNEVCATSSLLCRSYRACLTLGT